VKNLIPSLFVFKTSVESHVGEITYFKVMSGKITERTRPYQSTNGNKERLSQVFVSAGKMREKVEELVAGDLGCTVKLKDTNTTRRLPPKRQIQNTPIKFPPSKHTIAVRQ
jgi:elongation factor G